MEAGIRCLNVGSNVKQPPSTWLSMYEGFNGSISTACSVAALYRRGYATQYRTCLQNSLKLSRYAIDVTERPLQPNTQTFQG